MLSKEHIKQCATGTFSFVNSTVSSEKVERRTERVGRFRIAEVRSKDFIIENIEDFGRIYCQYPKNTKISVSTSGNITTKMQEKSVPLENFPGYQRSIIASSQCGEDNWTDLTVVTIKFHGF